MFKNVKKIYQKYFRFLNKHLFYKILSNNFKFLNNFKTSLKLSIVQVWMLHGISIYTFERKKKS